MSNMSTFPQWFESLVRCPETGQPVVRQGDAFVRSDGKAYFIREGVPSFVYPETLSGDDGRWNLAYEWLAPFYETSERVLGRLLTGVDMDRGRVEIVSHLGLSAGIRLLEVSPGPGVFQALLRAKIGGGGQLVSLDLSRAMLRQCQKRRGTGAVLVHGNGQHLPFADGSFDAVLHFGGINLFNDPNKAIAEFVRVTKQGGKVIWGDEGFADDYGPPWRKRVLAKMNPGFLKDPPAVPRSVADARAFSVYDGLGYLVVGAKA